MAVRLQIEGGELKEYSTLYGKGLVGGELGLPYEKYVTNCGQVWRSDPGLGGGCSHLDCAIRFAEEQKRSGYLIFKFSIVFSIGLLILLLKQDFSDGLRLVLSGFSILAGFGFLISGFVADMRLKELVEYRDKGTIYSAKAWQIIEDF